MSKQAYNRSFDLRITLYRALRTLLFAVILAFTVKMTLFDSIRIEGDQMSPAILKGDRLIIFRAPFHAFTRTMFKPPYDKPIVYKDPHRRGFYNILRVAAFSGDTISIDSAQVNSGHSIPRVNACARSLTEIVPGEYAPRDFLSTYRVPTKNDLVKFSRLSLRDFFFMRAVVQQENPKKTVTVIPYLLLDDTVATGYIVTDFSLYRGALDSVPDTLRNDWFFWYRLEEYLYQKHDTRKVSLYFTLSLEGTALEEYEVRSNYCFLLADNRENGFDSRYFGPVSFDYCIGKAVMVLWSHSNGASGKWQFRFQRLGKLIP